MTPPTKIDTASLLTILGVIAAVWALITPNARLRLRFCLAWWDWAIVGFAFLLSNYLVFAPALKSLGLYFSFGPWKWGLDSSSAVYLISLAVAIYILVRLRNPKLSAGRTRIFLELVENLHLTKRYDDLAQLLAPQLEKLILIINRPVSNRFCDNIEKKLRITNSETAAEHAHEALFNIVSSPELTNHFALAHPSLCLKLIKIESIVRSDFTSNFISALLSSSNSRLYVELKNNLNVSRGHRLLIPKSNRILHFFFSNSKFASDIAIYRDIGEYLYWRLDEEENIISTLNKPLGSYYDVSRYKCPIYTGVTLFEIMVHEGIHQGLQDHLWLHYYKHFATKIIKNMYRQSDEYSGEWETPFHFLLCHLFSVATDWAEQCAWIDEKEIPQENKETDNFDLHYISKEATKLLGTMLQSVLPNHKLTLKSRKDILGMVVSCYIRLKRNKELKDVADSLLIFTTRGEDNSAKLHYRRELLEIFNTLDDYRFRSDAPEFRTAIEFAIQSRQN
ncbi:TPA: hypothetical protein ACVFFV_003878 [Enterobacter cloacae]|uniref:hypothetical protein n=1 Tax=Citrobacter freundii TaxID=546 RepID=UPI002D7B977E|nr:hypothetical protein [Cronobacter sakazakii]HCR1993738.1 hypothetical protein [Enterobacter hormaechei subsp. steigerwaltii]